MLDSTGDFFVFNDQAFKAALGSMDEALASIRNYVEQTPQPVGYVPFVVGSDLPAGIADDRRLTLGDEFWRALAAKPSGKQSSGEDDIAYRINTGRPVAFQSEAGGAAPLTANVLNVWAGLLWDGDSTAAARSGAELARWASSERDSTATVMRSAGFFANGLWALSHGDTASVDRSRASLRKLRGGPTTPWLATTPMICEKLLAAQLAVARHSPDARGKLDELDSLLVNAPVNRTYVLNPANLLVSRLWERVGDDARALTAIRRRYAAPGSSMFASARLRASARIAERLGKTADALAALRTYAAIRAKADAAHQADLQDARATLARLEKATRGR